jgi:hypothetical protein
MASPDINKKKKSRVTAQARGKGIMKRERVDDHAPTMTRQCMIVPGNRLWMGQRAGWVDWM